MRRILIFLLALSLVAPSLAQKKQTAKKKTTTKRVVKKVQHRKPVEFSLGAYAKVPLGATVSIGAGSVAPAAAAAAGKSEGEKKVGRRGKKG